MKNFVKILIGVILIGCGALYVLYAFGVTDFRVSMDGWWTLFIILPCLNGLLTDKEKTGSLIGISVGVLLLLAEQNVFPYSMFWELLVPIVIILLGLKFIFLAVRPKKQASDFAENNKAKNGKLAQTAKFNEQVVNCDGEEVHTAKIGSFFGGIKCNLTNAKIKNGSTMDLMCAFGGAEIILPPNVTINNRVFCLFGGISDKRTVQAASADDVMLTINGFCLFGGADIK